MCPACVWQRNLQKWECALVYRTKPGRMEPWVEEMCDPQRPWGPGCKLCRLAGIDNASARGVTRAKNRIHLPDLQRHGGRIGTPRGKRPADCRAHMRAQEKVLQWLKRKALTAATCHTVCCAWQHIKMQTLAEDIAKFNNYLTDLTRD